MAHPVHITFLICEERMLKLEIREFGKHNGKKIVLVPGNMMCWKQFEDVIPLLAERYHVIAVSTDGYDGTGETEFTTSDASAGKLEKYIRANLDGEIELAFGESFGCATAGPLFHRQEVKVRSLILSGPQYMDLGPLSAFVTEYIPRNQYRLLDQVKNRKKLPFLLKLYTRSDDDALLSQFDNVPANVTLTTLKNCAKEGLRLYEDIDRYDPDPNAKVAVWHGAKEPNMKKALKKLRRAFPSLEDHPFPGFGHGEIIAHPDLMAKEITEFIKKG